LAGDIGLIIRPIHHNTKLGHKKALSGQGRAAPSRGVLPGCLHGAIFCSRRLLYEPAEPAPWRGTFSSFLGTSSGSWDVCRRRPRGDAGATCLMATCNNAPGGHREPLDLTGPNCASAEIYLNELDYSGTFSLTTPHDEGTLKCPWLISSPWPGCRYC